MKRKEIAELAHEARELALILADVQVGGLGQLGVTRVHQAADLLRRLASAAEGEPPIDWHSTTRVVLITKRVEAYAEVCGDGLVVKQGSIASPYATDSLYPRYERLRVTLLQQDVLVPHARGLAFAVDYKFTSPSAAASVLTGSQTSGNDSWKVAP